MLSRKTIVLCAGLVLVLGGVAVAFWRALGTAPEFYEAALREELPPMQRKEVARRFEHRTKQLVEEIQHSDNWSEEFTQTQINSWLGEELEGEHKKYVPKGVSQPRVQFAQGVMRVGFLYQTKDFHGIVSMRVRPWMDGQNRLALEVQSIRAGLVPLPLDDVIRQITKSKKKPAYKLNWEREPGSDTIVFLLDRGRLEDPVLESVEVVDGAIRIAGSRGHSSQFAIPFRTAEGPAPAAVRPLAEVILAAQALAVQSLQN